MRKLRLRALLRIHRLAVTDLNLKPQVLDSGVWALIRFLVDDL